MLKQIITSSPALVPFDPSKKTILQCDASKNGLGCCMFQLYDNNILKLVAGSSRSMNDHEVNYSQTEKKLTTQFTMEHKNFMILYTDKMLTYSRIINRLLQL